MKEISIAKNITELRKKNGMTQEQLAAALHVSPQAVSKWETGQSEPTAKNLVELARLFGMTVSELVEPEKTEKPDPDTKKKDWKRGLEKFAVIAYSAAAILYTIETNDPGFYLYASILILISAVFMAINIARLPSAIRLKMAVKELGYCIVIYCVVTFLEPIIRNVFTSVVILICCVVYVKYIRFKEVTS